MLRAFPARGSAAMNIGCIREGDPSLPDGWLRNDAGGSADTGGGLDGPAFFDDPRRFPRGSIALDNALIMRDIAHEWHAMPELDLSA
jgi:hypothetical protein